MIFFIFKKIPYIINSKINNKAKEEKKAQFHELVFTVTKDWKINHVEPRARGTTPTPKEDED